MGNERARGWIAALASGSVPLPIAFWRFGIVYGLIVDLVATLATLALPRRSIAALDGKQGVR